MFGPTRTSTTDVRRAVDGSVPTIAYPRHGAVAEPHEFGLSGGEHDDIADLERGIVQRLTIGNIATNEIDHPAPPISQRLDLRGRRADQRRPGGDEHLHEPVSLISRLQTGAGRLTDWRKPRRRDCKKDCADHCDDDPEGGNLENPEGRQSKIPGHPIEQQIRGCPDERTGSAKEDHARQRDQQVGCRDLHLARQRHHDRDQHHDDRRVVHEGRSDGSRPEKQADRPLRMP